VFADDTKIFYVVRNNEDHFTLQNEVGGGGLEGGQDGVKIFYEKCVWMN